MKDQTKSDNQDQSKQPSNQGTNQNDQEVDLAQKLNAAQEAASQKDQEAENIDNETNQLKDELNKMTELAKRTLADLENYRRRQEQEKSIWITMANVELIKAILPILDNFDRAITHIPENSVDWGAGLAMCIDQLHKVMENAGVKKIESIGKTFNPDQHQALVHGPGEKDIVIEELEKGYLIGDRVIRHSKVKVGNGEKE